MAITPTIGMTEYSQILDDAIGGNKSEQAFTYGLDVTQYFFINEWMAFRIDLSNRWYNEDILNYRTGVKKRSNTNNTTDISLGATFYF